MSRLRRMVFLAVFCSFFYLLLLLRRIDIIIANADNIQGRIPLLEYQPSSQKDQEYVDGDFSEENSVSNSETIWEEDTTFDYEDGNLYDSDKVGKTNTRVLSDWQQSLETDSDEKSFVPAESLRGVEFVKIGNIYVYGAYLDLRLKGNESIRIFALKHQKYDHGDLVCLIADGEQRLVLYPQPLEMSENHGKVFEGWIFTFALPRTLQTSLTKVTNVTISQRKRTGGNITSTVLRLRIIPNKPSPAAVDKIGVCVPPLFGNLSLTFIIHFIQMCKILGADKIFMYLSDSVNSEIRTFLRHHSKRESALSVIDWNLPENLSASDDRIWYHGQLLSIHDCLYHNMDALQYLLFMDLDEMLVPKSSLTWREMLGQVLSSTDRVAALSFSSAVFDTSGVPRGRESCVYLQHVQRARRPCRLGHSKVMVRASKVRELGIHHLSSPLLPEWTDLRVDPSTALLHHYHPCGVECTRCYPATQDTSLLRYTHTLTSGSRAAIRDAARLFA